MDFSVLIYSSDAVRGEIIDRSLRRREIESLRVDSYAGVRREISTTRHDVLIFDARENFWNELNQLKLLSRILKKTTVVVLADAGHMSHIKTAGGGEVFCIPDPFDPEAIVTLACDIRATKKKTLSAAVRISFGPLCLRQSASFC